MGFEYYATNQEYMKEEKARQDRQSEGGLGNVGFYLSNVGVYQIRVLPPFSPDGRWFRRLLEYRVAVEKRPYFLTAPTQFDLEDPVKETIETLGNSGNPDLVKKAADLKPRTQYLFNVLVLSAPQGVEFEFGKVYVLKAGEMVKRQIVELDQDEGLGWTDITNLENGVNLTIKRTGQGQFDTRYEVNPHGGGRSNIVDILSSRGVDINTLSLHNLDELCPVKSADEIRDILRRGGYLVGQPKPATGQTGVTLSTTPKPAATPVSNPASAPAPQTPQTAQPVNQAPTPAPTAAPPATPPPPPPSAAPKG